MATTKRKAGAGKRAKLPGKVAWSWKYPWQTTCCYFTDFTKGEMQERMAGCHGEAVKVRIVPESELRALVAGGGGK